MTADPFILWQQAGGGTRHYDAERYRELLREAGHITDCRCPCHEDGSGHCEKCRPQLPCGWPGQEKPADEWCIHDLPPGTCSVCTGRGEEPPDEHDLSALGPLFTARYPGKCAWCGEWFGEGDRIRADGSEGRSYVCEGCAA